LAPVLSAAFKSIERALDALAEGGPREVLTVSVVGTFAVGFLIERLAEFRARHPRIDLPLMTNHTKVDLWSQSLDFAIRFGAGACRGADADALRIAPLAPLCAPATAERLAIPGDLAKLTLLRCYRVEDWPAWLEAAGAPHVTARGPMFDSSTSMVHAAVA